jgi:hypothetical protein
MEGEDDSFVDFWEIEEDDSHDGEIFYDAIEDEPVQPVQDNRLDPSLFRSTTWLVFTLASYAYTINCLKSNTLHSPEVLLQLDPFQFDPNVPINQLHRKLQKKWYSLGQSLIVNSSDPNHETLRNQKSPDKIILALEQWEDVVRACHCSSTPHLKKKSLIAEIRKRGFVVGERQHGIPENYLIEFVNRCNQCSFQNPVPPPEPLQTQKAKKPNRTYDEIITVSPDAFDSTMKQIILDNKVNLPSLQLLYLVKLCTLFYKVLLHYLFI